MRFATGRGGVGFDHSYTMLDELRFFTRNRHELDGQPLPKPGGGYCLRRRSPTMPVGFLKEHAKGITQDPSSCIWRRMRRISFAGPGGRYRAV